MPWVRFDDQFPIHRKVAALSGDAFRLHVETLFWCARNLTDGYVPEDDLRFISAQVTEPAQFAAECVNRRVWHMVNELCPSEWCPAPMTEGPGWVIHDYWAYQPTRAQVLKRRSDTAERQARFRARRGVTRDKSVSNASRNASTHPQARRSDQDERKSNASRDASVTPIPPRRGGTLTGSAPTKGAAVKPEWCGQCDERSRQIGEPPRRCDNCHPLRPVPPIDPWAEEMNRHE